MHRSTAVCREISVKKVKEPRGWEKKCYEKYSTLLRSQENANENIFVFTNKVSDKRIIFSIADDMSNIIYTWHLN